MTDTSAEITVHEITVTKDALLKAPELERLFFILLGHFGNELVILSKMSIATNSVKAPTDVEKRAQYVQSVFITRLMMSKMLEGWKKLFGQIFLGRGLCRDYESKLSDKGKAALGALKKYFKETKYIKEIRNDFTFHYPDTKLVAAIDSISDTEDWILYLSRTFGDSLYYVADMIAIHALLTELDPNPTEAFARMSKDQVFLQRELLNLSHACMNVFVQRHLGLRVSTETEIKIALSQSAGLHLPYFGRPDLRTT